VNADEVALGIQSFGDDGAPLVLLAGGTTMLSWPEALCKHHAGIGVSGMVAQVAALDHPGAFSALSLVGTRAVATGRVDNDLPDHDPAMMRLLAALRMPDWTDRDEVAGFGAARAEILGDDPVAARKITMRVWTRTPGTAPAVQMANQMGIVFARLNCKPRWRERLSEVNIPTPVVHGRRNSFFPARPSGQRRGRRLRCALRR
jgi:pimeloyl-ACP methyl ester carboxylesterase